MIHQRRTADRNDQAEVIAFLADPSSYVDVDQVERFETHGNLVFLAGSDAWKIKRAIRFSYMDFSTLEKRAAACAREMESTIASHPSSISAACRSLAPATASSPSAAAERSSNGRCTCVVSTSRHC